VGLITYMRTDGTSLSQDAINAARAVIGSQYGDKYVPAQARIYKSTAKNAQEAHEAIRPTDLHRRPEQVAAHLQDDERRLYDLIWRRTIACEMESAVLDQVSVDIAGDGNAILRASGSIVAFDGFLKVYQEDRDDDSEDENQRRLPPLHHGDRLERREVRPEQHFTQPPPRYSEATLVKKLEELGIGRPSTYASIIQVLQDRQYVRIDKKRFVPEDRGRLVTAFLSSFFERYVQYNFTADLETRLDDIAAGRADWKAILREFWRDFTTAVDQTKDLKISDVLNALDADLGPHFFPSAGDGRDPRLCPRCNAGRLSLKLGKFGAFIGCANYPECNYTRPLAIAPTDGEAPADDGPRLLGTDPETDLPVTVRRGPFGTYVQLGPAEGTEEPAPAAAAPPPEEKPAKGKKAKDKPVKEKPKRVSLPKGMNAAEIDLDTALKLLALPRVVGPHPESKEEISAGIGRFGPYLKHGTVYKSLGADDDVLTIGLNRAVSLLAEAGARGGRGGGAGALRTVGEHPADKEPITVHSGRFGPYVKHGKVMATLPKGVTPEDVTVEQAVPLLAAKAAKAPPPKAKKAPAKKAETGDAPAKKAAAEKKPATEKKATTEKKPAAKKAPAKAAAKKPPAKAKAGAA
ncbi:MAG TPA: DNA topoisomerase, partial [Alphaproteobacteria bacterium]|nr:DNA topoisomerase [Alphaproteobacteria bacterium]